MISLKKFNQVPRDYQQTAIDRALSVPRGTSLLLASPTGTGKGTIELGLLRALLERGDKVIICTPSLEVVRGYLERCGATKQDLEGSAEALVRLGEQISVYTPIRLRNRLRDGILQPPDVIIVDEAHHATDANVVGGGLRELCPGATWIGFTATPYRGTPEETKELKTAWGEPHVVLTIPQAVENKSWALPSWRVKAIVDDDICGLKSGDIDADEVTIDQIKPLAEFLTTLDLKIPTCVTVPGVGAAEALAQEMKDHGTEVRVVVGETPTPERAEAYERVKAGGALLISVRVLGEGVDMPWLRRWVDASPTLSPVAFLQKLGRITRPNHIPPEYIGTNRNLERHGYLLQGCLPREEIKKAQEAFGGASVRGGRAGLLKAVKKLKPIELPLAGGVKGTMWALWCPTVSGGGLERCVLLDPTSDRVVSAMREIRPGGWQNSDRWKTCELPEKIEGFRVAKTGGPCTEGQYRWWKKAATQYGLDVEVRPNKAQFFALPVLHDIAQTMDGNAGPPPRPKTAMEKFDEFLETGKVSDTPAFYGDKSMSPRRYLPQNNSTGSGSHQSNPPHVGTQTGTVGTRPGTVAPSSSRPAEPPPVTKGYYTVVRENGSHRTYRIRTMDEKSTFAPGKTVVDLLTGPENSINYMGVAFADSTGLHVWRKVAAREQEFKKDWASIIGDVKGAGKRYAMQSGNCFICGKLLTTPESIAAGIGPVCNGRES